MAMLNNQKVYITVYHHYIPQPSNSPRKIRAPLSAREVLPLHEDLQDAAPAMFWADGKERENHGKPWKTMGKPHVFPWFLGITFLNLCENVFNFIPPQLVLILIYI